MTSSAGAAATASLVQQQRTQLGGMIAGGLFAAFVVLKVVRGKFGRGRRGAGQGEGSEEGGGGRKYRDGDGGGREGLTRTLMRELTFAERAAVRHLAGCGEALRQSGVNDALLRNDWRLGAMRLAPPNEPMPPGYGSVDVNACNLHRCVAVLDLMRVSRKQRE